MKADITRHGLQYFFEPDGYPHCPECGEQDLKFMDFSAVETIGGKSTVNFKCLSCLCEVTYTK